MGALYKSTVLVKENLKKEFVLERLLEKGITHAQSGKAIQECDYEELKYELVLSSFREIDVLSDSEVWF